MIKVTNKTCANGLPVVFIQNPAISGVVVTMFVKAGSAQEQKAERGISHLVEHLIFSKSKQTAESSPLKLELDARTRKDFCYFEISHHKDYLEQILKLLFPVVFERNFSARELETQKSIVAQEINENNEDPFSVLAREIDKNIHTDEAWAHDVLGDRKKVGGISLEMVRQWLEEKYTPQNMLLAISGNFDPEFSMALIEKGNSRIKTGENERGVLLPEAEYKKHPVEKTIKSDFEQSYIGIVFPSGERIGGKEYFLNLLIANIAERALMIGLKDEKDFYDVDFFYHQYLNCGEFRAITSVEKANKGKAVQKLAEKIVNLEISKQFFCAMQEVVAKQFELHQDNVEDLASLPMYLLAGGEKIFVPRQESKKIAEISYEEFSESLKKSLCGKNLNTIILG